MNVQKIMEFLPHRFPMLLVDRILEFEPMKLCVGLKNVTINEAFFQGHYPGFPIMPGVLVVESMAQTGACMIMGDEKNRGLVPLIGSIDNVKFRRPVVPGDQLILHTVLIKYRESMMMGFIEAHAEVAGERVAEMSMTFKMMRMESVV